MNPSKIEKIEEKFPQLLTLYHWADGKKRKHLSKSLKKHPVNLKKILEEKEPELLFILGAELGAIVDVVLWAVEKYSHLEVVLFEEDLSKIFLFFEHVDEKLWYACSSFHIKYVFGSIEKALEEAIEERPKERVEIYLSSKYRSQFDPQELSVSLRRKATLASSFHHEIFYYHLLTKNLVSNFRQLRESFYADHLKGAFKNIPAILCGAGPSLNKHIQDLKKLENKALIFGGGSTLSALVSQGVVPHLGFVLDPNPEEKERLHGIIESTFPLLYGGRLYQGILDGYRGPKGYLKTGSGGFLEQAIEHHLGLDAPSLLQDVGPEALSVTALALSAAYHMGCNPIILCGVDLAFVDKKKYAEGVILSNDLEELKYYSAADERLFLKNKEGKDVLSCVKWVMEQNVIEDFARTHPSTAFYDASEDGLGFKTFSKISLADYAKLGKEEDLKALVFRKIQECQNFDSSSEELTLFFRNLFVSLKNVELLLNKIEMRLAKKKGGSSIQEEDVWVTLHKMDLEEEIAYQLFFLPLEGHQAFFSMPYAKKISDFLKLVRIYLETLAHYDGQEIAK